MSSYRLSLSLDEEFQAILQYFKRKSPLLSDGDIIKMAVGSYFVIDKNQFNQPVEYLSDDQSSGIGTSKQQILNGNSTIWNQEDFENEMLK